MINVTNFKFSIRSGFKNRVWITVAISLFFYGSFGTDLSGQRRVGRNR
jgi:hypothetical protein